MSSASARCGPPRRPTASSSAAATTSSSRPSPSTASATPRSTGGRASSTADAADGRGRVTPTCARIGALRVLRRAAQPAPPQRGLGHCAATSSTSRPTARSATSGSAGPATSRSSHPPPPTSSTSADFLRDWLAGPRRRAAGRRRDGAVRRARRPEVRRAPAGLPAAGDHRDLERRRRVGAVGAVAGVRRPRCSSDQYDSMAAHVRRVRVAAVAHRTVGHRASSSATGWTRRPRRTSRRAPRRTTASSRPPASTATPACWPETAGLLGRDDEAAQFAELAERTRTAFNEQYVNDDGTIHSDCRTVYALAIVFGLLDVETTQLAGERLAELVAESGYHIRPASPARRTSPMR